MATSLNRCAAFSRPNNFVVCRSSAQLTNSDRYHKNRSPRWCMQYVDFERKGTTNPQGLGCDSKWSEDESDLETEVGTPRQSGGGETRPGNDLASGRENTGGFNCPGRIPSFSAATTRSASDVTFIFSMTRERCTLTVFSTVPSSLATCLLSRPRTTSANTSRSRGVRVSARCWSSNSSA